MIEIGVGLDGDQERLLVFRTATGLAAVAFAAEVGVVDLHEALESSGFFALGHGLHDLVLEAPGAAVGHTEVALEFERGEFGLGRGQQIDRQEPRRQRQLRVLQQRAADQRRLVLAGAALVVDLRTTPEARSAPIAAGRTAKSLRPARPVERAATLRFAAILFKESGQWQVRLKLDQVHAHRCDPRFGSVRIRRQRLRSCDCKLRFGANQVIPWSCR